MSTYTVTDIAEGFERCSEGFATIHGLAHAMLQPGTDNVALAKAISCMAANLCEFSGSTQERIESEGIKN